MFWSVSVKKFDESALNLWSAKNTILCNDIVPYYRCFIPDFLTKPTRYGFFIHSVHQMLNLLTSLSSSRWKVRLKVNILTPLSRSWVNCRRLPCHVYGKLLSDDFFVIKLNYLGTLFKLLYIHFSVHTYIHPYTHTYSHNAHIHTHLHSHLHSYMQIIFILKSEDSDFCTFLMHCADGVATFTL